jgi:subtilisin family serine protease
LVAPGQNVYSTYTQWSGTSAATPFTADIFGLMLAINPNLTKDIATGLLCASTDKVSGYSFSNTIGNPHGTWNNEIDMAGLMPTRL